MLNVPFLDLAGQHNPIQAEITKVITKVVASQRFVLDAHVACFEKEYASYIGTDFCCGVGNGLDAISIALRALDVGTGNEVLVPTNTSIATWLAVTNTGAKVIPIEPDPHTYTIDPKNIENSLSPKTKAIVPVHLYGQPCDMSKIMGFAEHHNLKVVEDNAQAHGAEWNGKKTGSFGQCNAHSFYPTKNLGAIGDAGAVTINSETLHEKVMMLRNYGSSKKNFNDHLGVNSRLDEMQAAILSVKLKYLNEWNRQRKNLANLYLEKLKGIGELILPATAENCTHVYHLFVVRTKKRDELQRYLTSRGIETLIHYPVPPHLQKAYAFFGYKPGDFPIAEELASTCLSLPLWVGMREETVELVCKDIIGFYTRSRAH